MGLGVGGGRDEVRVEEGAVFYAEHPGATTTSNALFPQDIKRLMKNLATVK